MTEDQIVQGNFLKSEIRKYEAFLYSIDPKNKGTIGYTNDLEIILSKHLKFLRSWNRSVPNEIQVPQSLVPKIAELISEEYESLKKQLAEL